MGYRLGVDLGTTYTAAAVYVDGRVEMLGLGNRAMQVASVLFVKEDGEVLAGESAERAAAAEPGRAVREFKRRIGDPVPLIVGGAPYSPQSMMGRMLSWVVGVAAQRHGGPPEHVCVTHPANWGPFKCDLLAQSVELAGLRDVSTCTEPEAAAITYASRDRLPDGAKVAVYDLGGGTFDAAVLIREGAGFRLAGPPEGIDHLGGIDFDTAVFQHVVGSLGPAAQELDGADPATARGLARLRRDCVEAKEELSGSVDATIPVALPGIDTVVRLTRGEFEDMLRPAIGETVAATSRVLESAGVASADLAAIVMVGGSSRIPLVSEELSAAFGRPLALDNHPKHDVALGAAIRGTPAALPPAASGGDEVIEVRSRQPLADDTTVLPAVGTEPGPPSDTGSPGTGQPSPTPRPDDPPVGPPVPVPGPGNGQPPAHRRGRLIAVAVAAVVLLGGIGGGIALASGVVGPTDTTVPPTSDPTTATPSPTPEATALPASAEPLANDVIVWPRDVDGTWDIATISVSTGGVQEIVTGPDQDNFPVISTDRRTVIYVHSEVGSKQSELRVVAADGTDDRALFETVPEGCTTVFRPAFNSTVGLLALPCFDPDTLETSLLLVQPDGTVLRQLDQGSLGDPAMTSDGRFVVYWRNDDGEQGGQIHRVPTDGSTGPVPITTGDVRDNDPAVEPDGSLVAITRPGEGIWTVDMAAGNRLEQLTDVNGDQDPTFSPDGSRIAFKRNGTEIWVMDADGTGAERITDPDDIGTAAAWSPR